MWLRDFLRALFRVGVRKFSQICRTWPSIQIRQYGIVACLRFLFRYRRIRICNVAEDNRLGWARLLARRHDFTFTNQTVLLLRRDSRAVDTLDTIRTLFHHTASPNRDIGV